MNLSLQGDAFDFDASAIRNAQLKMCGNGIVPAQIAAAFHLFWEDFTAHMTEAVAS